ncbi:MAG: ParA family protein, partial [Deltaproteobacteria bacterium]|nr:ParA family protein [Deltaproteobacteria bacterium]
AKMLLTPKTAEFDYVIIDQPPTVGLLNLMSLISVREAIIPVQTTFLSMEGLAAMVRFIYQINATVNPDLKITGIIPTFYNRSTRLSHEVHLEMEKNFGKNLVLPPIRQNVSIAEAPGFGECIFKYASNSIGASDYRALVDVIDEGPAK